MVPGTLLVAIFLLTPLDIWASCPAPSWPSFPNAQYTFKFGRWYYKVNGNHKNKISKAIEICGNAGARVIQIENTDDFEALKHYGLSK